MIESCQRVPLIDSALDHKKMVAQIEILQLEFIVKLNKEKSKVLRYTRRQFVAYFVMETVDPLTSYQRR